MSDAKKFRLTKEQIKPVAVGFGSCIASDRILVDGCKVGLMYREEPDSNLDSGWRFLAGDESDDYLNAASNLGLYDVNTVANYDPDVLVHLDAATGSAFQRNHGGQLQLVR